MRKRGSGWLRRYVRFCRAEAERFAKRIPARLRQRAPGRPQAARGWNGRPVEIRQVRRLHEHD